MRNAISRLASGRRALHDNVKSRFDDIAELDDVANDDGARNLRRRIAAASSSPAISPRHFKSRQLS